MFLLLGLSNFPQKSFFLFVCLGQNKSHRAKNTRVKAGSAPYLLLVIGMLRSTLIFISNPNITPDAKWSIRFQEIQYIFYIFMNTGNLVTLFGKTKI